MHILNVPPYCDDFISLLKRVYKSKLAASLTDFNLLHFLLVLRLLYQYPFAPCIENVTSYSSISSAFSSIFILLPEAYSLLIFIFTLRIQLFWLLSRADLKLLTNVSNNV
jgi:hypothetical protein